MSSRSMSIELHLYSLKAFRDFSTERRDEYLNALRDLYSLNALRELI